MHYYTVFFFINRENESSQKEPGVLPAKAPCKFKQVGIKPFTIISFSTATCLKQTKPYIAGGKK